MNDKISSCLVRLEDAQVLIHARRYAGACYLAGYAVELTLKAVIAQQFRAGDIPDPKFVREVYTHNLDALIGLADLREALRECIAGWLPFAGNWGVVKEWVPESRYDLIDQATAQIMIHAITTDGEGVLPWIRSYWTKAESGRAGS